MKKSTREKLSLFVFTLFFVIVFTTTFPAQSGGSYILTQNVIASGGGSQSTGGNYSLSGTAGQPSAGTTSAGNAFNLRGGFWHLGVNPTAAGVYIQGKVLIDSKEMTLQRVKIALFDATTGVTQTTSTNDKGEYKFDDLEIEHLYVIIASSRSYVFAPDRYVISLVQSLDDLNFNVALRPNVENEKSPETKNFNQTSTILPNMLLSRSL